MGLSDTNIVECILYSFRRCPYAMRARMALANAEFVVRHREVDLKAKPHGLLSISPKGTVPVLQLADGTILEESLDIIHFALATKDSAGWNNFPEEKIASMHALVKENDTSFKRGLDEYKYPDRVGGSSDNGKVKAELFLTKLDGLLASSEFLFGETCSWADVAIFPFIRQFILVDENYLAHMPFPNLKKWYTSFAGSILFASIMKKHATWLDDKKDEIVAYGCCS